MAGMSSIVALDIVNGLLITGGVLIAAPFALKAAGGWTQLTQTLPETHFTVYGATGIAAALGLFMPIGPITVAAPMTFSKSRRRRAFFILRLHPASVTRPSFLCFGVVSRWVDALSDLLHFLAVAGYAAYNR